MDKKAELEFTDVLSSYVNTIDNMRKRSGGKAPNISQVLAMNTAINNHANMLFDQLPPLNLHQTNALAELVNSRLNAMRMKR